MSSSDSSASPARLDWAGLTDVGRRRTNNEDSWGAWALDRGAAPLPAGPLVLPPGGVLLAVSDGMGGAAGGEIASRICVEELGRRMGGRAGADSPADALRHTFLEIHEAINAVADATPGLAGMGATLSAVWLLPDGRGIVVHVGDSRIYHAPSASAEAAQLTEDQSVGAAMIRRGEMTPEAVKRLRYRAMLEQVMGGDGASIEPQVMTFSWAVGSCLTLCSDGLHGPLEDVLPGRLNGAFAGTVAAGAQGLIDAANEAGGPDNVTVVLARFVPGKGA
jgi:PPM family protein phosphatase